MSETNVKINLPKLYLQINSLRQAQGLASVEPEAIAVQANLRFAVMQRRHLNLKQHAIELTLDDAEILLAVIEDLFKVRPLIDDSKGGGNSQENRYELPLARLYEAIHEQRKIQYRSPIETAVIAVRIGVKFLIQRRRVLDFKQPTILLDQTDVEAIEQILTEQFLVTLPMGLAVLCSQPQSTPIPTGTKPPTPGATGASSKTWVSRMLQQFTGYGGVRQRRYQLDISAMLLAITQQRAAKGHRYVPPAEIQRRYGERLALELQLPVNQDPRTVGLTRTQFATVAALIHKEFDVILPDLDMFIEPIAK